MWWLMPIDLGRPRYAAAATSAGLSIPLCYPCVTYAVYDQLLGPTVSLRTSGVRRGHRSVAMLFCFMFLVWYAKHSPVAFVFRGLDSPLHIRRQRQALTSIERYWQDYCDLQSWLCIEKLMASLVESTASPDMSMSVLVLVWSQIPLLVFHL